MMQAAANKAQEVRSINKTVDLSSIIIQCLRTQVMGAVPTVVHPEYKGKPGQTMKALAWFGPGDVRLIDTPVPDITEPDDVILKVTGTTICGSDLHLYHGEILALQKGDILGHGKVTRLCSFSFLRMLIFLFRIYGCD